MSRLPGLIALLCLVPALHAHNCELDESIFREASGEFKSPGYPAGLPKDWHCTYEIVAPEGQHVELVLHDMKGYMPGDEEKCRSADILSVQRKRHGGSVAVLCGDHTGDKNRWTVSENLFIEFNVRSINTDPLARFYFSWHILEQEECPKGDLVFLAEDEGVTASAGETYSNNLDCEFIIKVHEGNAIRVSFQDFEMEECKYDFLKCWDSYERENHIVTLCGEGLPEPFVTQRNYLRCRFVTDGGTGLRGYKLRWESAYRVKDFKLINFWTKNNDEFTALFELNDYAGNRIPSFEKIQSATEWEFSVTATSLDICDYTRTTYAKVDEDYMIMTYKTKLPYGTWHLRYMAESTNGNYRIFADYKVTSRPKELMELKYNNKEKKQYVDFMIYEEYARFNMYGEIEKLASDLKAGFQLNLKDSYVLKVVFTPSDKGYIKVRVWVRGSSLMAKLRKLCKIIASPYPFKHCWQGIVYPIRHGRVMYAHDTSFGYDGENTCNSFITRKIDGCSCPCFCGSEHKISMNDDVKAVK